MCIRDRASDTRTGLYVVPIWFLVLAVAWRYNSRTPMQQARIEVWRAASAERKLALTR